MYVIFFFLFLYVYWCIIFCYFLEVEKIYKNFYKKYKYWFEGINKNYFVNFGIKYLYNKGK